MAETEPVGTMPVACGWSMDYTMVDGSVRLVRIHLGRALALMGWRGDREDAVVIVSELVTNAICHGRLPGELLTVRVSLLEDGGLVLDVSDPLGVFPGFGEQGEPAVDEERGRGLLLVRGLGARLSWHRRPGYGKTVRAYVRGAC